MGAPPSYALANFLDEFVSGDARWRDEWFDSYPALVALHNAKPGEPVEMSDRDHERIAQIAKGANIPGPVAFRLMPMIAAITRAASV